jgi:hypothetical protein
MSNTEIMTDEEFKAARAKLDALRAEALWVAKKV